jgi:superfamily II helicase
MSDDESEDRLRALIEGLVSRLRPSVNEAELAEMEAELNNIIAVARALGARDA